MNHSPEVDKILPAFVKALGEMQSLDPDSSAKIPTKSGGSFSYEYVSLPQALAYAKPILAKNGLALTQFAQSVDAAPAVATVILHESGQWLSTPPLKMPAGGDAQAQGSAVTYAKRYSLMAVLGIATEDDDGAAAKASAQSSPPSKAEGGGDAPPTRGGSPSSSGSAALQSAWAGLTTKQQVAVRKICAKEHQIYAPDEPSDEAEPIVLGVIEGVRDGA